MHQIFMPFIAKESSESSPQPQPQPPTQPQRIVIDPITRIEGHLRLEAQIENNRVADAWSSAMMFRGLEIILKGRDPRDAWIYTQRICGV